jgi:hypothetical protein
MAYDIVQIRVGTDSVGIQGLKEVIEAVARDCGDRPDDAISDELLSRLSKKNYISERAREEYGRAFLREYKKALGIPYEEQRLPGVPEVVVLGRGCPQCDRLEKELMEAMVELDLTADLRHVRDAKEIGAYGVMGMPALLINGKVKCVGSVPPRSRIIQWLKES